MENVFKYVRKHKLISSLFFVLFFIIIPLAPFVSSPIGFISLEYAKLFLSYYGTILAGLSGGALTLFGVCWTIEDQRIKQIQKKDEEENKITENLRIKYKPFLILTKYHATRGLIENSYSENETIYLILCINNIGRGEAIDTRIKLTPVEINKDNYFAHDPFSNELPIYIDCENNLTNIIGKNGSIIFKTLIPLGVKTRDKYEFNVTITYNDLTGNGIQSTASIILRNRNLLSMSKEKLEFDLTIAKTNIITNKTI